MAAATSGEAVGRDQREADVLVHQMPRPKSDREAWEEELKELTALIAERQRELEATRVEDKDRRENLQWRIRRAEKRMADLRGRLSAAGG
jgi:chromosome segregation ATPase